MTSAPVPAELTNRQPGHQIVNHHALQRGIGEFAIGTAVPQLNLADRVPTARGNVVILSP
jgi:hypothetical protein